MNTHPQFYCMQLYKGSQITACFISVLQFAGDLHDSSPFSTYVGTHEVQSCVITTCSRQGAVNISCTFAGRSKAMGYLSILCSKTNPYQEMFVIANRHNVSSSDLNISISGVPPDNYTVVVFDLGMNGVPPVLSGNINYAAAEENITVTNPGEARVLGKGTLV